MAEDTPPEGPKLGAGEATSKDGAPSLVENRPSEPDHLLKPTTAIALAIVVALAGVGVAVVLYLPSPGGGPSDLVEIKIGVILSQTGQLGHDGALMVEGAKLKEKQVRAAGGFDFAGKKAVVRLIVEDDGTDVTKGRLAAEKLVNVDGVQAIVGDTGSSVCLAIDTFTSAKKVPTVSPSCTSPVLSVRPWLFRTVGSDIFQGKAMVDTAVAMKQAGLVGNKTIVFSVNNAYGKGITEVIEKRASEKGMEIIFKDLFLENQPDYDAQAAAMKQAKDAMAPGENVAVLYTSYPEDAVTFFGTAGKLGMLPANGYFWMGNDGIANSDVFVTASGINGYIQGLYATNPASRPGDAAFAAFEDAFRKEYGHGPTAYSATAYDAVGVVIAALKRAGVYDGEKIKAGLDSLTGPLAYQGVSGVKDFDENGDIRSQYYRILKVSGQEFVPTSGWWEDPDAGVRDFSP
ncbi:MAG TPA: ABC transporter substrate-binding protein [Thermoplasmata archaeon]|nr:ABC transporter substrate-binding protein [Thermoplasmata archaeon]